MKYVALLLTSGLIAFVVSSVAQTQGTTGSQPAVQVAQKQQLRGPRGPRGRRGRPGHTGPRGIDGPEGPPGPQNAGRLQSFESDRLVLAPGEVGYAFAGCGSYGSPDSGGYTIV